MQDLEKDKKIKPVRKIVLGVSIILILVLLFIGAGASLAWFNDSTPEMVNIFHRAEFDLFVSHKLLNGTYEEVTSGTKIFEDEALYEPGYVQVVYLKVENKGTIPFDYKTAVNVSDYVPGVNAFGQSFNLQDYLKFGLVEADTEVGLDARIPNREAAVALANTNLGSYTTDVSTLDPGKTAYMAIIVRLPEDVGNVANYRGTTVPTVKMGINVTAQQVGTF